ncbi:molybdate ABC transporter substrate-binding protein [Nevskia sp.]|uniref:molybdate ABC transporter substrate-binding protein n=1 Tax=Nevskia sp. TaxID=1929292 RepID=UPI003F72DA39
MKALIRRWLLALLVVMTTAPVYAEPPSLTIAAASDLAACMDDLNAEFRRQYPEVELKTTTGASGNFFAQIKAGAPFDVFLSADLSYPRELVKAGLAEESSLLLYATGHLALWTTRDGVDISGGLAALRQPALGRIAIANPDVAPYGRAAKAALQSAGVWDTVKDRLVLGENIAQTAQFVQTGNVDAGLVSLSLLKAPKMAGVGRYVEIPEGLHPRLEQGGVITRHGTANPMAAAYLRFLASPGARAVFDRYGFLLPANP